MTSRKKHIKFPAIDINEFERHSSPPVVSNPPYSTLQPNPSNVRLMKLSANKSSFKEISFNQGLNVILADRAVSATKKESRNGVGKSSIVEVISFCLGASFNRKSPLNHESLADWTFTIDLMIQGAYISATRSIKEPSLVFVDGDRNEWPISSSLDTSSQQSYYKVREWNLLLGHFFFGIPIEGFASPFSPSFRSLISYFVRRGKDAYSVAFEHYRKQQEWDKQVNNAFLLGIAWQDASRWQTLRTERKLIQTLKKSTSSEIMSDVLQGTLGELEAIRVRIIADSRSALISLNSFEVLPQYRELENEAAALSSEISDAVNRIVFDKELLASYEASLKEVPSANIDDVVAIWNDAGVYFPDQTRRTLEDVKTFHFTLLENRRRFLSIEIQRLSKSIRDSEIIQRRAFDARAAIMRSLQGRGALDQLFQLQKHYSDLQAQLKAIEARIELLNRIESGSSRIRIEEETLKVLARNDLDDRKLERESAIRIFNDNSQVLYESPGNLLIDVTDSGFKFDVNILRSGSQGVGNMKIFCYDLMLAEIWSGKSFSPGFLIHDSPMFDGVDERQIALCLELAEKKSRECGFQYICTLNSDSIPWSDFSKEFPFSEFVALTLTDKSDEGSLFGFRF